MKNASKKWYNYIFAALGIAFLVGVSLGLYFTLGDQKGWPLKYSWFLMIFGGITFVMVGFIIQDLYRGWKRHKLHDWDNPLPDEVVNKAWSIFFPLLTSGILTFLAGLIAFLITK
ncbi:MAG: hypothetical protein KBS97_00830 [Firmicutes bacterium]|nr:hypothetical protein [Candidatus Fiminaster equi]